MHIGQEPDRIGPDDCGIPPRGGITPQATTNESYKSFAREGPVFFQRSRCVFPSGSEVPGGFSDFWKIMIFHHVWVKKLAPNLFSLGTAPRA